jgi:hypothetical protein
VRRSGHTYFPRVRRYSRPCIHTQRTPPSPPTLMLDVRPVRQPGSTSEASYPNIEVGGWGGDGGALSMYTRVVRCAVTVRCLFGATKLTVNTFFARPPVVRPQGLMFVPSYHCVCLSRTRRRVLFMKDKLTHADHIRITFGSRSDHVRITFGSWKTKHFTIQRNK